MWELVAKGAFSKERVKGGKRSRDGQTHKAMQNAQKKHFTFCRIVKALRRKGSKTKERREIKETRMAKKMKKEKEQQREIMTN